MDIIVQYNGVIYPGENIQEINNIFSVKSINPYFIEVPITFVAVESGPKWLNNISIEKIIINSKEFLTISNPSFHSYKIKENKLTICGENLGDTFKLKDDEINNSNATVVFKFLFDDSENYYEELKKSESQISFKLNLILDFHDAHGLMMKYSGIIKNFKKGTISKPLIKRSKSILLTQINLIGLILFIAALSFWNYGWNRDIFQQKTEFFSHEFFTATIGVLATFLGLSFKKIKSLFAVFTGTMAFFKFPELHLSLEQFRGFSNKQWSVMLITLVGISGYFIYDNWSFKTVVLDGKHKLYDRINDVIVKEDRIYYSHILEDRFSIINSDLKPYHEHMQIGRIKSQGIFRKPKVIYDTLTFIVSSNKQLEYRYRTTNIAKKLVEDVGLSKEKVSVDSIFTYCPKKLGNYIIEYFPEASKNKSFETIFIRDYIIIKEFELIDIKDNFTREEFKTIPKSNSKYISLYQNRTDLINMFLGRLEKKYTTRHKIDTNDLLNLTQNWLKEIQGDKSKAMERFIMLSALWDYNQNNIDVSVLDKSTITSISNLVYYVYERHVDWLIARMSVDFLLKFQKNLPNTLSKIPLEKIKNEFITLSEDKFNIVDLIFISAKNNVINNKTFSDYIVQNLPKINRYNSDTKMQKAILLINESNQRHVYDYLHEDSFTINQINSYCSQKSIRELYENLWKQRG